MSAWEWIAHYAKALMNQPWFIAVTTIAETALFVLIFVSKTSFGKKAIAYLKAKSAETAAKSEASAKLVAEYISESKKDYETLKADLVARTEAAAKELLEAEDAIYSALELVNNAKVRQAVADWRSKRDAKAKELLEAYSLADERYKAIKEEAERRLEELEAAVREYEGRVKALEAKEGE